MPAEGWTHTERAALIVLLAEGRTLTNDQMEEAGGFRLVGAARRRLEERKLITSERVGRSFAFEITDDGAAWCRDELSAPRPPLARPLGGALYAVLRGLGRTGTPLAELFPFRMTAEEAIRHAYERARTTDGGWLGLTDLRRAVVGVSRVEMDAELVRMASTPGVHLQAEPHRSKLTDLDRDDAVRVGGTERHMIMIEAG